MAASEVTRRRWMTAFSAYSALGGFGSPREGSSRRSQTGTLDWTSSSLSPNFVPSSIRSVPSAVGIAPPAPEAALRRHGRLLIDEEIFRGVLVREQKRAERFRQPFVLLLVGLGDQGSVGANSVWRQTASAVMAATRDTDVVGWVTRDSVLGVILTELGVSDADVARKLEMRVHHELAAVLDQETIEKISVRLHFTVHSDKAGAGRLWPTDPLLFKLDDDKRQRWLHDVLKRAFDVLGSGALLLLLSPLFLVIALLVKLRSPGPIFFRQVRVGQNARPFTMLKFRSMLVNADCKVHQEYVAQFIKSGGQSSETGTVYKLTSDPRITPIGHILRKTSLDELPQLWNVFRGDMSLVGPRPPLFYETEQYQSWHWRRVLDAKPGVTGLWQVTGRSRTTFDAMVRLDLRYVKTRSLWNDIKILLATPAAVINGKGAC